MSETRFCARNENQFHYTRKYYTRRLKISQESKKNRGAKRSSNGLNFSSSKGISRNFNSLYAKDKGGISLYIKYNMHNPFPGTNYHRYHCLRYKDKHF